MRKYIGIKESEIPKLLLKNERLTGVKIKEGYAWFFYVNGINDVTITVWDYPIRNMQISRRGSIEAFERIIWDILGYDEFFHIFKDSFTKE